MVKDVIEKFIRDRVTNASDSLYREPLIGYAKADDPIFVRLKESLGENCILPTDLLPDAKSVLAFFLPYSKEVVAGNKDGDHASREWADAYDFTNKLINDILLQLNEVLKGQDIKMAWLLPTYEFDKQKLMAQWSHKHVAYACGLGTFGQNQMLITAKGSAGRFGTAVVDTVLEPSLRPDTIHSCFAERGCDYCLQVCPAQALSPGNYDRHKCYELCLINEKRFPHLSSAEVCGKCATGPCGCLE